MTLLISMTAAIVSTMVWYFNFPRSKKACIGYLCFMYWGATIMWIGDAIIEYLESGADYFTPPIKDMVNDAFLGFSAVVLGLLIWLVIVLVKDPNRVLSRIVKSDEN